MTATPTKSGTYGERVSRTGALSFYALTPAMIARRHALADALGYVVRNPCSLSASCRFDCYESKPLRAGCADHHHVHDTTRMLALGGGTVPDGVRVLVWPEVVEAAAWAVDKGRDIDGEQADGEPARMVAA